MNQFDERIEQNLKIRIETKNIEDKSNEVRKIKDSLEDEYLCALSDSYENAKKGDFEKAAQDVKYAESVQSIERVLFGITRNQGNSNYVHPAIYVNGSSLNRI